MGRRKAIARRALLLSRRKETTYISLWFLLAVLAAAGAGCGPKKGGPHPVDPTKPIDRVVMEPTIIEAFKDGDEYKLTSYDAESLFEAGLTLLNEDKSKSAFKLFKKVLEKFPDTKYKSAALFNAAFCLERISLKEAKEERLSEAIALYNRLVSELPDSPDVIDALFREGYCLEALGQTDGAIAHYAKLLKRPDLKTEDKIELKARIGKLLVAKADFKKAEEILRETVFFYGDVSEEEERIDNNYYAAQAQFEMAEIYRMEFEAVAFSIQEEKIREEFAEKLTLMMKAKDAYVETIKIGNYDWAVAGGYKVGMLLRTLYDQVLNAPVPPKLDTKELQEMYREMLGEKVAPLLESAMSVWNKTLLMAERVGYTGEWVAKIEGAMDDTAKLTGQTGGPEEGAGGEGEAQE